MTLNQLLYRIARPIGGLQWARYISRRHPKILMYHRLSMDGRAGTIGVDRFREQMEILRDWFHPMTMTQLLEANETGSIPDNAVVVTFDDGYHDFVDHGLPILKELRIPATLFVTTGFVGGELWLWPDQIRYAIEQTRKCSLTLPFSPKKMDLRTGKGKEEAWNLIADHCMAISNQDKQALIVKLYDKLGVSVPCDTPEEYRALTWEQIIDAVKEGIEVGSHSHTHPILTQLNFEELTRELRHSKEQITRKLGEAPKIFCYPNGQGVDFNQHVKNALSRNGYEYALVAFPGLEPLTNRWEINRYPVSNDWDQFEKSIYGIKYFGGKMLVIVRGFRGRCQNEK